MEGQGQYIFTTNHLWKEINTIKATKVKYFDKQHKYMDTIIFLEKKAIMARMIDM